jgi:hypothetical protein
MGLSQSTYLSLPTLNDDMTIFDWEILTIIDKFNWEISIIFPYRRFALETIVVFFSNYFVGGPKCHLTISTHQII